MKSKVIIRGGIDLDNAEWTSPENLIADEINSKA